MRADKVTFPFKNSKFLFLHFCERKYIFTHLRSCFLFSFSVFISTYLSHGYSAFLSEKGLKIRKKGF